MHVTVKMTLNKSQKTIKTFEKPEKGGIITIFSVFPPNSQSCIPQPRPLLLPTQNQTQITPIAGPHPYKPLFSKQKERKKRNENISVLMTLLSGVRECLKSPKEEI